ncbi:hypothetical protein CMV_014484 [Castanea mollissima]|uniref:Secreted protein n=1 Tax=Castanea mollissima TaxID=60419 RepID=A0A8J4VUE2_9ROSI|nr:hypothetical protein CMV_014484 [Castanea mollissima]
MLQLFFAVAFSAVPLTLYVPPIRSLNLFVATIEELLRQTTTYTVRAYPRIRLAFSRILNSLIRLTRDRPPISPLSYTVSISSSNRQLPKIVHK